MKKDKSSLLLIPFLVITIPIAFIAQLFEKSLGRSKGEVEVILNRMLENQPDENLWDEFLSIPIKDKELDKIREDVEVLWSYDEFHTKNKNGQYVLNLRGLAELDEIVKRLRFGRT